jgi:hypothetical protein
VLSLKASGGKLDPSIAREDGVEQYPSMGIGHLLSHCFREGQSHKIGLMFVAIGQS